MRETAGFLLHMLGAPNIISYFLNYNSIVVNVKYFARHSAMGDGSRDVDDDNETTTEEVPVI